jgi:hypothetical protein
MRVPMEWLRELVDLPPDVDARAVAERLIAAGLEVESVEVAGGELTGPLVMGRVEAIEELTDFKKPIRWCQVDVGACAVPAISRWATTWSSHFLELCCPVASRSRHDRPTVTSPTA